MIAPETVLQNRYVVGRQLGQGGMGAVYEAVDRRLGTTVALKQTLMTSPDLRRAFEREAKLLSGLRHPALPHVTDFFAEGQGEYIVMQFIPGEDFAEMLEKAGAPLDNNICERALKKVIQHRKNSLFYKTLNGARVGDYALAPGRT